MLAIAARACQPAVSDCGSAIVISVFVGPLSFLDAILSSISHERTQKTNRSVIIKDCAAIVDCIINARPMERGEEEWGKKRDILPQRDDCKIAAIRFHAMRAGKGG